MNCTTVTSNNDACSDDRQFDPPLFTNAFNRTLPKNVQGRMTRDDYIMFHYDVNFPYKDYVVCAQTFTGDFRRFSDLKERVELPAVQFVNDSLLVVVHRYDRNAPRYAGVVQRGHTYTLSQSVLGANGYYVLT